MLLEPTCRFGLIPVYWTLRCAPKVLPEGLVVDENARLGDGNSIDLNSGPLWISTLSSQTAHQLSADVDSSMLRLFR